LVPRKLFLTAGSDLDQDREGVERPLARCVVGEGRCAVTLAVFAQGHDRVLRVTGGRAHVGAVALGVPADPGTGRAYTALAVVPGHAEGPLAEEGASRLSTATARACVALVGIHQDDATPEEIAAIVRNAREGFARLVAQLAGGAATRDAGRSEES